MKHKIAKILFLSKKHSKHLDILAQLNSEGFDTTDRDLVNQDNGSCSFDVLSELAGVELIIIYLSEAIKKNICLQELVEEAVKKGIRIVGIWIDLESNIIAPDCVELFSDSICVYSGSLSAVFASKENIFVECNGDVKKEIKIKKHICG
jgi:hypothetical protein